jgi:peroxin-3
MDRRRRRGGPSLTTVVTTAAVAYGTYRLASWVFDTWNGNNSEDEENEMHEPEAMQSMPARSLRPSYATIDRRTRQVRRMQCRVETAKALNDFLPTLKKILEEQTNFSGETRQLKQLRVTPQLDSSISKSDLWDAIQLKSVTRLVATAYSYTLLSLTLNVQLHLLGARLLQQQQQLDEANENDSGFDDSTSRHKIVLTRTLDEFFQQSVPSLVNVLMKTIKEALVDWDVTDTTSLEITSDKFQEKLTQIRMTMEQSPLITFIVPESDKAQEAGDINPIAKYILDETWDIMESPAWEVAERDSLDTVFHMVRAQGWDPAIFGSDQEKSKPLAVVVTKLRHTVTDVFYKNEGLFAELDRLSSVIELGQVSFY